MMTMTQLCHISRSWYPLAVALSLWLLYGVGCSEVSPASKAETPRAPAVPVTVIQVTPRTIPLFQEYTGTTDATETAEIRARVDGYLEQRRFEAGQLVKADQLLYVLDQRTYRAELQKAKARVAKAEADLQFAKEGVEVLRAESRLAQSKAALVKADQDVARYRPLVRQEAAPKIDLDAALAQQQVLREEVSVRKAELDQTKLQQRTVRELQGVRSVYVVDQDDTVVARPVTAGERIGGLWVIDKGLEARDRVIVEGLQRVQPGATVRVTVEPEPTIELAAAPATR
jgi:membrane fusion protein, multidrug efflux system